VILTLGVLTAAAILGVVLLRYTASSKLSQQQDMVRAAITTFDTAVRNGDLATLRGITCGQTRENYVNYDDQSWADTYSRVLAAQQYPVVGSVDEVIVNGDHAEANVTSYLAFDPSITSTRSFDLQFRDEQWKICQST
jgi:type II secretory pathway pseudopilin PulG